MEMSPLSQVPKKKQTRRRRRTSSRKPSKKSWKVKLSFTWRAMKKALTLKLKQYLTRNIACNTSRPSMKYQITFNQIHERYLPDSPPPSIDKSRSCQPHKTLATLLHVPRTAFDFIEAPNNHMTPTLSPRENISTMWKDLHGFNNWDTLLEPLHPLLRREVIKYGDFVSATYDSFDFDPLSEYCGSCRYNKRKFFQELGLTKHGYNVTKYLHAMSHVDVPDWLERSNVTWSKDSNWMGYVAVSNDDESRRIGRRDIVVAWRGTVAPTEWFSDLKTSMVPIGSHNKKFIKVQDGFLGIYMSKSEFTRYNKQSASEQVMQEVKKLVNFYRQRNEEVSLTVTGHSLGGALALLTAYEAAKSIDDLFISVISFGAPRVGNIAFKAKLNELKVKTLRVVVEQDIVPKLPGIVFNHFLKKLNSITQKLNWIYRHVGTQLKLDMFKSPYLKHESDISGSHNVETYLHLLDGYRSRKDKFRPDARRDLALVNKSSDMLIQELKIPEFWYQMPYKGLVFKNGRWVKPSREPEDIPSPFSFALSHHNDIAS